MLESGQGALKITNAHYYIPSGRNIHRQEGDEKWGVDPSEGAYVPMSQDQTQAMIETRRKRDVLRHEGEDTADGENGAATQPTIDPAFLRKQREDPQLAAALEAMLGKLKTGDWPKVGQSDVDQLVQARQMDNLRRQRDMLQSQLDEVQKELEKIKSGVAQTQPATQPMTNGASADPATDGDSAEPAAGDAQ